MTKELYYVIYSPSTAKFIGEAFDLGPFENATRYFGASDAQYDLDGMEVPGDLKVVGPCNEGDYK